MRIRTSRMLALSMALLFTMTQLLAISCGDEEEPEPEPSFPENPGPITISADQRGLALEMNRSYSANRVKYQTHTEDVSALFIYEQIFSEYWEATEVDDTRGTLEYRLDDLWETFPDELGAIPEHYIVVDLQRLNREWLVDWTGGIRDEPEHRDGFTFEIRRDEHDNDYALEVQAQLEMIAERYVPQAIIIGTEMNKYYQQNPTDWWNFVEFYWTMYDAIKATNSSINVAPGLNWSYFTDSQIEAFVAGEESVTDVAPFRRAYQEIIAPLLTNPNDGAAVSDFLGLSIIPDATLYANNPSNVPERHFAGLRLLFPTGTTPLVFFQVGWPVTSTGSSIPSQFYSRLLDNAGGVEIERISWYGLTHLLDGDCIPLTSEQIGAPQSSCYRGMFSVSGADSALSDIYFSE